MEGRSQGSPIPALFGVALVALGVVAGAREPRSVRPKPSSVAVTSTTEDGARGRRWEDPFAVIDRHERRTRQSLVGRVAQARSRVELRELRRRLETQQAKNQQQRTEFVARRDRAENPPRDSNVENGALPGRLVAGTTNSGGPRAEDFAATERRLVLEENDLRAGLESVLRLLNEDGSEIGIKEDYNRLRDQLRERFKRASAGEQPADAEVLFVIAPAGPYAADQENRLRIRYATQSALGVCDYRALSRDRMDSFDPAARESSWEHGRIPYEWFRRSVSEPELPAPVESEDPSAGDGEPAGSGRTQYCLVLWIPDTALDDRPLDKLEWLRSMVQAGERTPAIAVIGPRSSRYFKSMLSQDAERWALADRGKRAVQATLRGVDVLSCAATANFELFERLGGLSDRARRRYAPAIGRREFTLASGLRVRRVIGKDEHLVAALMAELELRNATPRDAASMALVAELGSTYVDQIVRSVERPKAERDIDRDRAVREYRYLAGLDGSTPGGESRDGTIAGDTNAGPAQFDYIGRIQQQMASVAQARGGLHIATPRLRTIGVLSADVYDKLVLVETLRASFPDALLFTTDLNTLLVDGGNGSRNLLVASHFGLELREQLQGQVPPFRDNYQTATFLSVLVAMHHPETHQLAQRMADNEWEPVRLFEVGRRGAIPLADYAVEEALPPVDTSTGVRPPFVSTNECFVGLGQVPTWFVRGAGARSVQPERRPPPVLGLDPGSILLCIGAVLVCGLLLWRFGLGWFARRQSALVRVLNIAELLIALAFGAGGAFAIDQTRDERSAWIPCVAVLILPILALVLAQVRVEGGQIHWRNRVDRERWLVLVGSAVVGFLLVAPWLDRFATEGEPLLFWAGISAWPTIIICGIACLVSFVFFTRVRSLTDGARFELRDVRAVETAAPESEDEGVASERSVGVVTAISRFLVRAWRDYLRFRVWRRAARGVRRATKSLRLSCKLLGRGIGSFQPGDPRNFSSPWSEYGELSLAWRSGYRILVPAALATIVFLVIVLAGVGHAPIRGWLARVTLWLIVGGVAITSVWLVAAVVDRLVIFAKFVARLTTWVQEADHEGDEIDIVRRVARYSERVGRIVRYPFILLLIVVLSRSLAFDRWAWSIGSLLAFGIAFAVLSLAAVNLRLRAAELRTTVLARLEQRRNDRLVADDGDAAMNLGTQIDLIRDERRGAFRPALQEPLLQGILIPLSGYSSVNLLHTLQSM